MKVASLPVNSLPVRLLVCAGLAALALSWGMGQAHAASSSTTPSLDSTDQTMYLTAVNASAVASDGADYKTVLNANGLFVSVTTGSVAFTIPGSETVKVDAGDVIVITGNAARGTYIDVLNGAAEVSNGINDDGPMFVTTSVGIAFAPGDPDADLSAALSDTDTVVAVDLTAN